MRFFRFKKREQIDFEEVLLDASSHAQFDTARLEGRIEVPLTRARMFGVGIFFVLVAGGFAGQLFYLQIVRGNEFATRSTQNRMHTSMLFAERGVVYDRNGERLAWNTERSGSRDFSERVYTERRGMGQVLGYVNYPRKDASGFYFRTEYAGRGGVEEAYNTTLAGINGEKLLEVDVHGVPVSEHVVRMPKTGDIVTLSIDARVSEALYDHIATSAAKVGFRSGAGAIMDISTGELVVLASYPSFDPNVMVRGDNDTIAAYTTDERLPFLNKIISGIYTPGSVVKPFVALAALRENLINPNKEILSTGSLIIPNPYTPSQPSVFTDWKAHGLVDMRRAIAVSSNIYFYVVGGGLDEQKGVGITKLSEFFEQFGLAKKTGIALPGETFGVIPTPKWKQERFDDEWRLGDTYNTSIGQFGFQVTPLALLRAYAGIATGGVLPAPTVLRGENLPKETVSIDPAFVRIVHEGMRLGAVEGTARAVSTGGVDVAAKTGTAELGSRKEFVNSWVVGFYPYEKPRYAFVLLMERGPRANLFGASPIMGQFFAWMRENAPQYITEIPE